jgi:hypothetical protein
MSIFSKILGISASESQSSSRSSSQFQRSERIDQMRFSGSLMDRIGSIEVSE